MTITRYIAIPDVNDVGTAWIQCSFDEKCQHLVRYTNGAEVWCACHIPMGDDFQLADNDLLKEAIEFAALEHEDFQINAAEEINLTDEAYRRGGE
jgi:hypothetical protein